MNIERIIRNGGVDHTAGLFSIAGSFGIIDGTVSYEKKLDGINEVYSYENGILRLEAKFTKRSDGSVLRCDSVKNVSSNKLTLNRVRSRFTFEGGEYKIYSQTSNWQHENVGRWQTLGADFTHGNNGIRSCDGATPMMALENSQNGRLTVFHLFPNCQWRFWVRRCTEQCVRDALAVEYGLEDSALALDVAPGETIYLPELFFFDAKSRTSFDSHKLHAYMSESFPAGERPIIYNTWMRNFDFIHVDEVFKEAEIAAELGIEIFCIDAGWFGKSGIRWVNCVGDWKENMTGGFCGRVRELSDKVRSLGMKFGIWIEPERAHRDSEARSNHPDEYIAEHLLDFGVEKARERIFRDVCEVIDKYNVEYLKFDFNSTVAYDPSRTAFYRYSEGKRKFMRNIRERYPNVYITGCASGGLNSDLSSFRSFDSIWLSDNHSQHDGLRIITDYIKRAPSSLIERWNVQTPAEGIPNYLEDKKRSYMLSCNNASWDFVINVEPEYTFEFLKGGPLGYSCNLAAFPEWYRDMTKKFIASYKESRGFFKDARCHVLVDTGNFVCLEYFSKDYKKIYIQFFTKLSYQESFTVYPILPNGARYEMNGASISSEELMEDGIVFDATKDNFCASLTLEKL
jgi:hypothetical protein